MEYSEKITINDKVRYFPAGLRNGTLAGALMGIYLFGLKWFGVDPGTTLKFLKYLILFSVIFLMLRRHRESFPPVRFFRNGILLGLVTSAIAGFTLLLINGFSYALGGADLSLGKFGTTAEGFGSFMLIEGVIFFEVLVYGMISVFISLQYLKYGGKRESAE